MGSDLDQILDASGTPTPRIVVGDVRNSTDMRRATSGVDAVVYYRVSNATVSVANVENAHHSTRLLAQTTLRNILGTKSLHEILSDRESISNSMQVGLLLLLLSKDRGVTSGGPGRPGRPGRP